MTKILLLLVAVLCFNGLKAQTYTHGGLTVTVTDSMSHDSTYCNGTYTATWHVKVNSSFLGDSVMIGDTSMYGGLWGTYYNTTGASPWIFAQSFGTNTSYDIVPPSSYMYWQTSPWVKIAGTADTVFDAQGIDSFFVTNPCSWADVSGRVYIDYNANCTFDSTDVGLNKFTLNFVEYVSSPADSVFAAPQYFDSTYTGWYGMTVQKSWMVNYKVSLPASYAFIFPTSPCFAGTGYVLDTVGCSTADFPLLCSSNVDAECGILSAAAKARLHRPFTIHPYVNNSGCTPVSGQMVLVLDSRVIYDPTLTTHPADIVHGDSLIWNYTDLSSLAGGSYWNSFFSEVYLTFNTSVAAGDTVCFQIYTGIPSTDIDPSNNSYSLCLPVVYSFDPNSKDVSPVGSGPQGYIPYGQDTLTYTLHFQNTGSDIAEDIRVIDTLNANFNMHSLKILGASHAMTPTWLAPNVVAFNFSQIYLADSFSNEPASHGAVQFSIVTNPGVPLGTPIRNTGYIYFDLNPPVVTNTTLNTIELVSSVVNVKTHPIKIYPNPATDMITVESLDGGRFQIIDMKGTILMDYTVSSNKTSIDVSRLPGGVYLLKTTYDGYSQLSRFTKF